MNEYTAIELVSLLKDIPITPGDNILVHSSLLHLGRISADDPQKTPEIITDILLDAVGESGTILAPAFNYDFCNGIPFDRWKTPSKNMGALSETIRTWPGAQRSKHPMQSVASIGFAARKICEPDQRSSFAIGGPFDLLFARKSKLLFIGATMQAASLIHYTEECLEVPYRYWKSFSGTYTDRQLSEKRQYDMYVRNLDSNPQLQLKILEDEMASQGLIRKAKLGMGTITCCTFSDFRNTSMAMVEEDPFVLLKNREEVIASLKREKRND